MPTTPHWRWMLLTGGLLAAVPALADSPRIPQPVERTNSPSNAFTLESIRPDAKEAQGLAASSHHALANPSAKSPRVESWLRLKDPAGKALWTVTIDYQPGWITVADSGRYVALFSTSLGIRELPCALVLLGARGELLRGFKLGDLLQEAEIASLTRSTANLWWYPMLPDRIGHRFLPDDSALEVSVAREALPPPIYPQPAPQVMRVLLPSLKVDPPVEKEPPGTADELVRRYSAVSGVADERRRELLTMLLQQNSARLRDFWLSQVKDPARENLLMFTCEGLLRAGGPEVFQPLIPTLGRSPEYDACVLKSLLAHSTLRTDPAPFLARARDQDATEYVRRLGLLLAFQVSSDAPAVLEAALREKDPQLRKVAADHLRSHPCAAVVPQLLAMLADPEQEVRAQVAASLAMALSEYSPETAQIFAAVEKAAQKADSPVRRSGTVLLALAQRHERAGRLDRAEVVLRQAVKGHQAGLDNPNQSSDEGEAASARLARLAWVRGRTGEALKLAAGLKATDPKTAQELEGMARSPLKLTATGSAALLQVTAKNTGQAPLALTRVQVVAERKRETRFCDRFREWEEQLTLAPGQSRTWELSGEACPGSGPTTIEVWIETFTEEQEATVLQRARLLFDPPAK